MPYLDNPICRLQPRFEIDESKKNNQVIICLFQMDRPYKSFSKYTDGLRMISRVVKKKLPDFRIRLFVDHAIDQNPEFSWIKREFEIVRFRCEGFLQESGNKEIHRGTFGTLVRFFPMFDFPGNDADHLIIMDADLLPRDIHQIIREYHDLKNQKNLSLHYHGNFGTGFFSFQNPHHHPHFYAGRFISFKRLPPQTFLDFLEKLKNGQISVKKYRQNKGVGDQQFEYGIDEFYLNHYLIPEMEKQNQVFSYYLYYSLSFFPYYLKQGNNLMDLISHAMGKYFKKDKPFKNNLNYFDKLYYNAYKDSPQLQYITPRFYYMLQLMKKQKMYKMIDQNKLETILNNFLGIASGEMYRFSDNRKEIVLRGLLRYSVPDLEDNNDNSQTKS